MHKLIFASYMHDRRYIYIYTYSVWFESLYTVEYGVNCLLMCYYRKCMQIILFSSDTFISDEYRQELSNETYFQIRELIKKLSPINI